MPRTVCCPLACWSTMSKPFQLAPREQLWWRTDIGLHSVEIVQACSNSSGLLLTMARLLLLWETNYILARGKDCRLNVYGMFIYLFIRKENKIVAYCMVRLKIRWFFNCSWWKYGLCFQLCAIARERSCLLNSSSFSLSFVTTCTRAIPKSVTPAEENTSFIQCFPVMEIVISSFLTDFQW